jgi:hypothetical protein
MKNKILEILDNEVLPINDKDNELVAQQICDLFGVSGSLNCWVKDTAENEKILVRESENGLKYLIFDDDSISYARVGKKIGEHETIHFNGKNGKSILEAFSNDR